jgi:hypothetical protein
VRCGASLRFRQVVAPEADSLRWLDSALAEYEALRAEVLATLRAQQAILTFGTAALGVLAAGAFNVWDDAAVVAIVFLGVTPLLSGIVLVIWAGEYVRRLRAGAHLKQLEAIIRDGIPGTPEGVMAWEASLLDPEGRA